MSDEQKANPDPLPGLAHDFHCTHERTLCRCWAIEVRSLRARLDAAEAEVETLRARLADAPAIARLFHETYERLAPDHGYETRKASAVPWADVPPQNKGLMVSVAAEVGRRLAAPTPTEEETER